MKSSLMAQPLRSILKETSRRPRNRNQYLYVRSIGTCCSGTCPTATQGSEWLSRKIPGAGVPVPHVLLDVVVRGESFAPQGLFRGPKMA